MGNVTIGLSQAAILMEAYPLSTLLCELAPSNTEEDEQSAPMIVVENLTVTFTFEIPSHGYEVHAQITFRLVWIRAVGMASRTFDLHN